MGMVTKIEFIEIDEFIKIIDEKSQKPDNKKKPTNRG